VTRFLQRTLTCADESAAAAIFGGDHALVRALAYRRCFACQALVTSIPVAFGVAGTARHHHHAPAVLAAAAAAELVLVASILITRGVIRERVQTLIVAGAERVPLRLIADERQRLLSQSERERLALSLESALHAAQHWNEILPSARPPHGVRCLRFTDRQIHEIVSLLRSGTNEARGVALTARFLADGCHSALYSGDVALLREELNRIRYLLATTGQPDEAADLTRIAA
jgi:hypothetical protein